MSTYSVTVVNGSQDNQYPHRYFVFAEPPTLSSQAYQSAWPVVCWSSPSLTNDGRADFEYTSQYYAFVGVTEVDSAKLKPKDKVKETLTKPVAPETAATVGTDLVVSKESDSVQINDTDKAQSSGTGAFRITLNSTFTATNKTVIGLARKIHNKVTAVAAIAVKPQTQVVFIPKPQLYIARVREDETRGTVLKFETVKANAKMIDFGNGDSTSVVVTENENGTLSESYT